MGERKTSGRVAPALLIVVVAISLLLVVVRPDLWVWAAGFAVFTIVMISLAHHDGIRQGLESARSMQPSLKDKEKLEEKPEAESRLEAFQTAIAEAELFAYELDQGLVPDGNSEHNQGYGPMDFGEWREWKEREFERTGNLWFNHPGGLPPSKNNDA